MFDAVSKYLTENHSQDFAIWLLGSPCALTRLEPSELSIEAIRTDALIFTGEDKILHIEMQTRPDPSIPFRLLDYRTRIYRKYPEKEVHQVVIYLKPSTSKLVHQTKFEILGTSHQFAVIRLWEQPTNIFTSTIGLLPLAVLSNTSNQEETLIQVAEIIDQVQDTKTKNTIIAVTAVLAGLLLEKEVISRVLRRDIMQESVIYQEILEEGIQKGLQKGRQEGIQIGVQQGKEAGITEAKILIAKNMLSIGISVEQVAVATGLSQQEVDKLFE